MTSVDDMMASAEGTRRQRSAEVKERKMSFEEVKKLLLLLHHPPVEPLLKPQRVKMRRSTVQMFR